MRRSWLWLVLASMLVFSACERTAPVEPTVQPTMTGTQILSLSELTDQTLTAEAISVPTGTATQTAEATEPSPTMTLTGTGVAAIETEKPTATATATNTLTPREETELLMAAISFERYFDVQQGTPVGMVNWTHPEAGCNWLGVGGQVFDVDGDPEIGFVLEAGGSLEGEPVLGLALTGLDSAYGPGGYEIQLADHTIASQDQVWIQLKDDAGEPLSYPIYIETYDNCEKNLTLLNFVEASEVPPTPETFHVFLPLLQGP